jgi:hypothetical protein
MVTEDRKLSPQQHEHVTLCSINGSPSSFYFLERNRRLPFVPENCNVTREQRQQLVGPLNSKAVVLI